MNIKFLKQLIWIVTLFTISSPAWAIPGVGALFTAIFSAFTAAAAFVSTLGFVGQFLVGYLAQQFLGFLGTSKPDLNNQQSAEQQAQGVQVQRKGSVEQIPIVYGRRKLAGVISFATTGGDTNKYMWVCYTFAEGPVEGIRKIYIDDWDLDTDAPTSSNPSQYSYMEEKLNADKVAVDWGKYKGRVQLFFSKGNYVSDPSTLTNTLVNSKILGTGNVFEGVPTDKYKTTMVHNGLVTVWARYEWFKITDQTSADANPFGGSIPIIHLELLGKKVQPLWISSTNNTQIKDTKVLATSTDTYGVGTLYYSTNPAEILLDYLRNPRYGKGLLNDDIHWDSWYKAAAKCNQLVPSSSSGQSQPILSFNGIIPTDATLMNNIKIILQNMRAYMPYTQGKFKLKIEDAGNETDILSGTATIERTFTNNNIVGEITYAGIERSVKYNQIALQYVDPDQKYTNQTVVYPPTEDERTTYINQDGGREYKLDITFPGITSADIARDMAKLLFNKSRYQETCSLKVTSEAFDLELGDCVYIQSKILNFADIPWRIISKKINVDFNVNLECVRNPDFIYPWVTPDQPDVVLPVYVPKGARRDAPASVSLYPSGLIPPTRVYHQPVNPIINPTGSNVANSNNSYGGGGATITSYPLNDTVTFVGEPTVNNINGQLYARVSYNIPNNPLFAGVTIAYYDANSITEVISTTAYGFTNVSGGVLGDVITLDNTTNPGAGKTTSVVIGPLKATTYEFRARVYYSSGEYSSADAVTVFDPTNESIDTTITALPTTTATTIDSSSIRAVGVPKYNLKEGTRTLWKDGTFGQYVYKELSGAWVNSSIVGQNQGWLNLWLWDYYPSETANRVVGVNFYFKLPAQTAYHKQTLIHRNWTPGSLIGGASWWEQNSAFLSTSSATQTSKLLSVMAKMGTYDYSLGSVANWDNNKSFDCIIRLVYKNGSESAYQHKFTFTYPGQFANDFNGPSNNGAAYDAFTGTKVVHHPVNTKTFTSWTTNKWSDKTPAWQDTTTTTLHTSAPARLGLYSGSSTTGTPALYANGVPTTGGILNTYTDLSKKYIRMAVAGVYDGAGSAAATITLKLYPPSTTASGNGITGGTGSDRSYWRGTKISYRPVRPGFTVSWITISDKNLTVDANGMIAITLTAGIFYDQLYEIVVTPQILDASQFGYTATNTTTEQDAYYSLYGVGFVNNVSGDGYPTNGNWNWMFNWNTVRTSYALQSYETNLPTSVETVTVYPGANSLMGVDPFPQIVKFNTRCVNKDISRSITSPNAKDTSTGFELNFYHQAILYVGHIANYSKLYVYRRHNADPATTGHWYGMGRWERILVTASPTAGNITLNLRGPTHYKTFANPTTIRSTTIAANAAPLANGTTQIVSAEEEAQEFLFIVETTGNVLSTVGSFITTQRATGGVDTNQLSPTRYQVLKHDDFQYITYIGNPVGRNLSEARTTVLTANVIGISDSIPYSSNGSLAGITKTITYPTTDFGANISPAIV